MISEAAIARSIDDRIFELIILPTEKCNFRCTYCYEDFKIGRMKPPTVGAVKKLLDARAGSLGHLSISWFGGEPMLGSSVIYEIAQHAYELSTEHGFTFGGGLTTNGYLLTERHVRMLHSLNHSAYQITLDGEGERHDATRQLANGKGTFEAIWKNLLMMRDLDLDLQVTLRVHVTPANKDEVPRLLLRINDELSSSGKFAIHFHRVSDLGGPGGAKVEEMGWEEYGRLLRRYGATSAVPSSSEHKLAEEGHICYAAKPNSLLIRADGRIGKCTVALDDPRNDVGQLNDDGTIHFHNDRLRLWFEGFRNLDPGVLGCPLPSLGQVSKSPASPSSPLAIRVL